MKPILLNDLHWMSNEIEMHQRYKESYGVYIVFRENLPKIIEEITLSRQLLSALTAWYHDEHDTKNMLFRAYQDLSNFHGGALQNASACRSISDAAGQRGFQVMGNDQNTRRTKGV